MRWFFMIFVLLVISSPVRPAPVRWPVEEGGNDHYYEAIEADVVGLDWEQARDGAAGMGGYLATITSAAENEWVWNQLGNPAQHFLGGHRSGTGWAWITGESWDYTAWAPGEPNNSNGGEPYLEYALSMDWNDVGNLDLGNQGYVVE